MVIPDRHELTFRTAQRVSDRDAYSVTLEWERNGDRLGIAWRH
jgi:hypothetical protein